MARRAKQVPEGHAAKRTWTIPGHLYNKFVSIAERRGLDATAQLVVVIEEFVRQQEKAEKSAGNLGLVGVPG